MTALARQLLGPNNNKRNIPVRTVIRWLQSQGWYEVYSRTSHRQFKHPTIKGKITVSGQMKDDVAPCILTKILAQSGN